MQPEAGIDKKERIEIMRKKRLLDEKKYKRSKNCPRWESCACGELAMDKFDGKYVCGECLNDNFEELRVEDFVYSGESNMEVY